MRIQRNANTPRVLSSRPLTEADLELLRQPVARVGIRSIRDSHHHLARHLASGLKLWEVSRLTGYSMARISLLRHDPAMEELIAHYRGIITEEWREEQDSLATMAVANMTKAERMLADKLDAADEAGETLPTRELIAITSDRMDRFGYSKKTVNANINVDFAANLERAIAQQQKKIAAE